MGRWNTFDLGTLDTLRAGLGRTHHSIQEGNAAGQLGPRRAKLSEQQAPNGLPLAQAVVVTLCKQG